MGASSTHILWLRYRGVEAYVHTHDDMLNLVDPSEYEDPVSQRAMAFCHVAKLADTVQDEAVKELCLTMLRKLNASIRTPSGGPPSIEGGHRCLARWHVFFWRRGFASATACKLELLNE
jgi:hypothetical protein